MADKPEAFGYAHCLEARGFKAEADELRRQHNLLDVANTVCRNAAEEIERLQAANLKLAGAIDMIRETLNGGNVDDLLYIINTALAEHRRNHD
jgi:hypothetical protein